MGPAKFKEGAKARLFRRYPKLQLLPETRPPFAGQRQVEILALLETDGITATSDILQRLQDIKKILAALMFSQAYLKRFYEVLTVFRPLCTTPETKSYVTDVDALLESDFLQYYRLDLSKSFFWLLEGNDGQVANAVEKFNEYKEFVQVNTPYLQQFLPDWKECLTTAIRRFPRDRFMLSEINDCLEAIERFTPE